MAVKYINVVMRRWCHNGTTNSGSRMCVQASKSIVLGQEFTKDSWTNVTPTILGKVGKSLHNMKDHPLEIIKRRIQNFFNIHHRSVNSRKPIYACIDDLSPVVTVHQNFDSLLISADHVTRAANDNYYLNRRHLLRAHTSAHQLELMTSGLEAFLVTGDVYRRDQVDVTHYPVFHQLEGVRTFHKQSLFPGWTEANLRSVSLFDVNGVRTKDIQETHSLPALQQVSFYLRSTLEKLVDHLFGKKLTMRWVDAYFPFTHPSWELEVYHNQEWIEVLGCGIIEQQIIRTSGSQDRVGFAFGLGLERLAMVLFQIPDIRLFWSQDPRFLEQFSPVYNLTGGNFHNKSPGSSIKSAAALSDDDNYRENVIMPSEYFYDKLQISQSLVDEHSCSSRIESGNPVADTENAISLPLTDDFTELDETLTLSNARQNLESDDFSYNLTNTIVFRPFSKHPPFDDDVSFWLPNDSVTDNDFYDITRTICGDFVESVFPVDQYQHPETDKLSKTYRIRYRHAERTLTKEEIGVIRTHLDIQLEKILGVEIRRK